MRSFVLATAFSIAVVTTFMACATTGLRPLRTLPKEQLRKHVDEAVSERNDDQFSVIDTLNAYPDPRTVGMLCAHLLSDDANRRNGAAIVLAQLSSTVGIDTLTHLLDDTSAFVRWAAARTLGSHKIESAASQLRVLLNDTAVPVRAAAATSLGALRDTLAIDALIGRTRDPAEEVRASAARALGEFGAEYLPILRGIVEDDNELAVTSAIDAMGLIGDPSVVQLIGVALLDGTTPTRVAASRALGRIGGPEADTLLMAVAADDPQPLVREAASLGLGESNTVAVIQFAERRWPSEQDVFVRLAWIRTISADSPAGRSLLRRFVDDDPNPDVRRAAAIALGNR
jgi:HEAT repeat protein